MLKKNWKNSLVVRSLSLWIGIVLLMIGSMSASLLITQSTDGDAERINISGSLRMQSYRISQYLLRATDGQVSQAAYRKEIDEFDRRLAAGVLAELSDLPESNKQHNAIRYVHQQWFSLRQRLLQYHQLPVNELLSEIDAFVVVIDDMVRLFEESAARKIQWLELVHGVSLVMVFLIAVAALVNLYRSVIVPIRRLASAADKVRHGELSVRVEYANDDELGVLVQTFNHMANSLQLSYQNLENLVNSRTASLREKTASLELLYETSRLLHQGENLSLSLQQVLDCLQRASLASGCKVYLNEHALPHLASGEWYEKISEADILTASADEMVLSIDDKMHHYGYLRWQNAGQDHQCDEKRMLLEAVADQIASAFSQEWKNEQSHRLMLAEERATIARELHDSIAQALAYLKMQVAKWQTLYGRGASSEELAPVTAQIREGINTAYTQLRELLVTFRLRLDDPGLEAAIKATVAEYKERGQLDIVLEYKLDALSLRPNAEIHMLQIVREALSNVVRHAHASWVHVLVEKVDGRIELFIVDNGVGVPEDDAGPMHHGLTIMSERAQSLGAEFSITNQPEGGAKVRLSCPLEAIIKSD